MGYKYTPNQNTFKQTVIFSNFSHKPIFIPEVVKDKVDRNHYETTTTAGGKV